MTSTLITAFVLGLISACSLPLGTITSAFWRPGDRVIAFLMSFGGGALLAALMIDLAGPALTKGHFYELAAGCILGGILFVTLDQLVNQKGGFLRKMSTTVFYLRRKEAKRFKTLLTRLKRLSVFTGLPRDVISQLGAAIVSHPIKKGETLFRENDPGGCSFIIEYGSVDLLDSRNGMKRLARLKKGDSFGHNAFLTNSRHAAVAKVQHDGRVFILPRTAFEQLVTESEELQGNLEAFFALNETGEGTPPL